MSIPVTVEETNKSRKTDWNKGTREYIIKGCFSEAAAMLALLESVPSLSPLAMPLSVAECSVEEVANDIYLGTAVYAPVGIAALQQAGSFSVSFDIGGSSVPLLYSNNTIGQYPASGEPTRDFGGALEVDEDRKPRGIQVEVPCTVLSLNYTLKPEQMTEAYFATLSRLVGSVNSDPFKGFDAGELLFTRASGQQRDAQNWDLGLGFAVAANREDFTVCGIHVSGLKRGWDHLWVYFRTGNTPTAMSTVAAQVNIEEVRPFNSFATLGLP